MPLRNQLGAQLILYFLSFIMIRWFISGVKSYQLNRSAIKKRKKGEKFKEWLFYSRYRDVLPKWLLILYFLILIINPFCTVACIVIYIIDAELSFWLGDIIMLAMIGFAVLWLGAIGILFWSPTREFPYERWIDKKGQRKKKKKK